MKPKYTSIAAMISFEQFPTDDNLMLAVQDAWYDLTEEFDFLDTESGSLSVPIATTDGNIVFIYTMRAIDNLEITYDNEEE